MMVRRDDEEGEDGEECDEGEVEEEGEEEKDRMGCFEANCCKIL